MSTLHDVQELHVGPDPIDPQQPPLNYLCKHNGLYIQCLDRNVVNACAYCGCTINAAASTDEIVDPHDVTKTLLVKLCTKHREWGESVNILQADRIYDTTLGDKEKSHLDARGNILPRRQWPD